MPCKLQNICNLLTDLEPKLPFGFANQPILHLPWYSEPMFRTA
jgi:hypothetical protein